MKRVAAPRGGISLDEPSMIGQVQRRRKLPLFGALRPVADTDPRFGALCLVRPGWCGRSIAVNPHGIVAENCEQFGGEKARPNRR